MMVSILIGPIAVIPMHVKSVVSDEHCWRFGYLAFAIVMSQKYCHGTPHPGLCIRKRHKSKDTALPKGNFECKTALPLFFCLE